MVQSNREREYVDGHLELPSRRYCACRAMPRLFSRGASVNVPSTKAIRFGSFMSTLTHTARQESEPFRAYPMALVEDGLRLRIGGGKLIWRVDGMPEKFFWALQTRDVFRLREQHVATVSRTVCSRLRSRFSRNQQSTVWRQAVTDSAFLRRRSTRWRSCIVALMWFTG